MRAIFDGKVGNMKYAWLKWFDFELGDFFPYFKITLKIVNPWEVEIPFYTFVANLRINRYSYDFGNYLYVGDHVNSVIKPKEVLSIEAFLRMMDVHANEIRKIKETMSGLANFQPSLEITLQTRVSLLNYEMPIEPVVKGFSLTEVQKWIERSGEVRNDFIPVPSHNALISLMYRNIHHLQKGFPEAVEALKKVENIENRLKVIESNVKPIATLFEKGFKGFLENRYGMVMPIAELIKLTTNISGNLDQNWAISALALSLLENLINLKLEELGEKPEGDFKDRVKRLKESLVRKKGWKEEEASELARKLREKYTGRSIVLHSGYSNPVSENLAHEDLEFVKEVMKKLFIKLA
ncbi:MAG: hypothetical protein QXR84_08425 [Candidatus Bathyarchaeia archaeon]